MTSYSLSVWLDPNTAKDLHNLCNVNERNRSDMVKVLIRKAARDLIQAPVDTGDFPVKPILQGGQDVAD